MIHKANFRKPIHRGDELPLSDWNQGIWSALYGQRLGVIPALAAIVTVANIKTDKEIDTIRALNNKQMMAAVRLQSTGLSLEESVAIVEAAIADGLSDDQIDLCFNVSGWYNYDFRNVFALLTAAARQDINLDADDIKAFLAMADELKTSYEDLIVDLYRQPVAA